MRNKGQSAIEYLTTYGWMLLAVAVVGGAIFTTIQNQDNNKVDTNLNNNEIKIENAGITQDSLKLNIRSTAQDNVEIKEIKLKDSETGLKSNISPKSVLNFAETSSNTIEDVEPSTNSETYQLEVTYDTGSLKGLKAEGEITANLKLTNKIEITQTKFNRTEDELKIQVKNTGQNTSNQIKYTLQDNQTFTGTNTQTLNPGEKTWINISLNQTYPLSETTLKPDGSNFENTQETLKCTPTEGLVGYWSFNNEQTIENENKTLDLSGNKKHGEIINGTSTKSDGQVGEAYQFDGQDDYVNLTENEDKVTLNTSNSSISYWIKKETNNYERIFGLKDSVNSIIEMDASEEPGKSRFYIEPTNNNEFNLMPEVSEDITGEWHHFNLNFKKTKPDNTTVELYYDGEKVDEDMGPFASKINISTIGAQGSQEKYIYGEYFEGKLDEVRIYNRTLTDQEVERLYDVRSKDWATNACKIST